MIAAYGGISFLSNTQILSRFTSPGESWQSLADRVSASGEALMRQQYRELIRGMAFIPSGQILRGAGHTGSVLHSCFVTGVGQDETKEVVAARISEWTKLGAGVGVNLDALANQQRERGGSVCDVIEAISRSQHSLWLEGITRTATMVTLSVTDPEVEASAILMTSAEHFRHLNLGIIVRDSDVTTHRNVLASLSKIAWRTGNPGFLFIDRVHHDHPFPDRINACNPCGEQFLADDEGCNLGSLNLASFVCGKQIDWVGFDQAARLAIRFLDDMIDASNFPSSETLEMAKRRRRVGLGVLGFASALHKLGVPYGSADSVNIADSLGAALRASANAASADLALERGAFPDGLDGCARNSHLLSVAPTGAISLLCNATSGIEPFFGESISKGKINIDFQIGGDEPASTLKPLRGDEVPSRRHVAVLAAWQRHIDGGISKTVNLPCDASAEDILATISEAWQKGCKGISLFRDGSRRPAIKLRGKLRSPVFPETYASNSAPGVPPIEQIPTLAFRK